MRLPWSRLITAAGVAMLAYFAVRFPWSAAARSLEHASLPIVLAVVAVNLLSLLAKGGAWHVLLRRRATTSLGAALGATIIGAAVGSLGPSIAGEVARLRHVVGRRGATLGEALSAVVASRVLEAVALLALVCVYVIVTPAPWLRDIRVAAPALLGVAIVVTRPAISGWISRRLPPAAGAAVSSWCTALQHPGTALATGLSALNWLLQWSAYAGAALAVGLPHAPALGLGAMVASNIAGAARLTPGNIGVLQAAFALAAAPLGIDSAGAVAASIVLQAAQVLPVLAAGALITVRWPRRQRAAETPA